MVKETNKKKGEERDKNSKLFRLDDFEEKRDEKVAKAKQAEQTSFCQKEKVDVVNWLEETGGGSDIAILFHDWGEVVEPNTG